MVTVGIVEDDEKYSAFRNDATAVRRVNFSSNLAIPRPTVCICKKDITSTQTDDSGDWTYHVMTAPQNLASAGDGTSPDLSCRPTEIATGTLRFDSSGRLISNITSGTASFVPKDATAPQMISFDFGNGTASGGSGLEGLTQYAATSAINFIGEEPM